MRWLLLVSLVVLSGCSWLFKPLSEEDQKDLARLRTELMKTEAEIDKIRDLVGEIRKGVQTGSITLAEGTQKIALLYAHMDNLERHAMEVKGSIQAILDRAEVNGESILSKILQILGSFVIGWKFFPSRGVPGMIEKLKGLKRRPA